MHQSKARAISKSYCAFLLHGSLLKNKWDKMCTFIDIAVPSDTKVPEKLCKYRDLETEII